jgi:hypothetical protein
MMPLMAGQRGEKHLQLIIRATRHSPFEMRQKLSVLCDVSIAQTGGRYSSPHSSDMKFIASIYDLISTLYIQK